MKVTVITAVLNGVEIIEDCIKSVFSQSHKNIEHIIIDGGSTDGTLDVIKKYENKITKCSLGTSIKL
jgi:glycosyltransferase involved in cell wall biosynthesis